MAVAEYPKSDAGTIGDDVRVSLWRVEALHRIAAQIMGASSEQQVYDVAVAGLVAEARYVSAWIATVDHTRQTMHGRAGVGLNTSNPQIYGELPLAMMPEFTQIIATRKPFIIHDAVAMAEREGWGDDARAAGLKAAIRFVFGTPDQVLGVVAVNLDAEPQPEELTLITIIGAQLTTALLNHRLNAERAAQIAAFRDALQTQERLLATVRELSTPAIPIYDGILALPLVGNIDSLRANQVMETVLESIAREHASVVILDVTGVPIIDTGVANHLVQVTQAAQLLGARALLVGIKPEVAQTLVQLGVDLRMIITRSNLQEGVAFALAQRGLKIVETR